MARNRRQHCALFVVVLAAALVDAAQLIQSTGLARVGVVDAQVMEPLAGQARVSSPMTWPPGKVSFAAPVAWKVSKAVTATSRKATSLASLPVTV